MPKKLKTFIRKVGELVKKNETQALDFSEPVLENVEEIRSHYENLQREKSIRNRISKSVYETSGYVKNKVSEYFFPVEPELTDAQKLAYNLRAEKRKQFEERVAQREKAIESNYKQDRVNVQARTQECKEWGQNVESLLRRKRNREINAELMDAETPLEWQVERMDLDPYYDELCRNLQCSSDNMHYKEQLDTLKAQLKDKDSMLRELVDRELERQQHALVSVQEKYRNDVERVPVRRDSQKPTAKELFPITFGGLSETMEELKGNLGYTNPDPNKQGLTWSDITYVLVYGTTPSYLPKPTPAAQVVMQLARLIATIILLVIAYQLLVLIVHIAKKAIIEIRSLRDELRADKERRAEQRQRERSRRFWKEKLGPLSEILSIRGGSASDLNIAEISDVEIESLEATFDPVYQEVNYRIELNKKLDELYSIFDELPVTDNSIEKEPIQNPRIKKRTIVMLLIGTLATIRFAGSPRVYPESSSYQRIPDFITCERYPEEVEIFLDNSKIPTSSSNSLIGGTNRSDSDIMTNPLSTEGNGFEQKQAQPKVRARKSRTRKSRFRRGYFKPGQCSDLQKLKKKYEQKDRERFQEYIMETPVIQREQIKIRNDAQF